MEYMLGFTFPTKPHCGLETELNPSSSALPLGKLALVEDFGGFWRNGTIRRIRQRRAIGIDNSPHSLATRDTMEPDHPIPHQSPGEAIMTDAQHSIHHTLDADDKITRVMAYTQNGLVWGEVVTKRAIRVSIWLRTQMAPQYVSLHAAQTIVMQGGTSSQPQRFRRIHLPTSQINAFHITPPDHDPVDYDVQELNRKMAPVTAMFGSFRFDGLFRMSTQTDLESFLDVSKEPFVTMYEVQISQPAQAAKGVLRVHMALLRRDQVLFAVRE